MLRVDRPGVFRGRLYDHRVWIVVDPSLPDPLNAQREWNVVSAPASPARRFVAIGAGWIVAAAIVAVGVLLGSYASERYSWILGAVALIGCAIGALVAGLVLASALAPVAPHTPLPGTMRRLDRRLVMWADDTTDYVTLWALQGSLGYLQEIQEVVYETELLHPLLKSEHQRALADLEAIAVRTGFPIPKELRTLDTPTAD